MGLKENACPTKLPLPANETTNIQAIVQSETWNEIIPAVKTTLKKCMTKTSECIYLELICLKTLNERSKGY